MSYSGLHDDKAYYDRPSRRFPEWTVDGTKDALLMRKVGLGRNGAGGSASLWGVLAAVLVIVVGASYFVDRLNGYAEDRVRAQAVLFSIEKDASQQAIAEYEAINEGEVTPEVVEDVAENRRELRAALDELERLDPRGQRVGRVRGLVGAHEAAIDEELRLIEAGRVEQAEAIDEERVDPGFEALQRVLEDTSAAYEGDARRAVLIADVSTYAAILLAAITLAALLLVSQREQTRRDREEAERRSQERFRSLVQNASDVILVMGADRTVSYVSPSVERVLGYKPEDVIGKDNLAPVHPDDLKRVEAAIADALSNPGIPSHVELRLGHAEGSWRHIESSCTSLLGDPAVGGIVFNSRDVTERKEAERALREAEERYRTLVEQIPAMTYVEALDEGEPETNLLYVSPRVQDFLGYSPEEWIRSSDLWSELMHPDDLERVREEDARTEATGDPFRIEYRLFARDGRLLWIRDEAVLVRDDSGQPRFWQGVMYDITERKALERRLEHQAFHDSLTGLPNRALFAERLARALASSDAQGGKVAVLFVDLDDFKSVNDSLGHWAGDGLLEVFARRLQESVRPGDTVARFGGDEFAVLLEGVTEHEAVEVAERAIEELRGEPFILGGREILATPSVGVALSGHAERGGEDLLRRADLALHRAKEEGKARHVCFTPDLEERLRGRLELEGELRAALERREFRVFYQPKVSIGSGEIVGMEALVRWQHLERGLLPPSEFLALAEETGLVVPIGEWVLREACRRAKEWQGRYPKDPPLAVSVNLSAKQFRRPDLAEYVGAVLGECGLDPRALTLEITERTAMEDAPATAEALRKLKAMGVRIEVDDFGTGYSSLSYLRRFPVDYLKVDRSFVGGLGQNPNDEGIVRAIIELAHTLGLEVVAEGVESGEQLGLLREMGCELAQGHYFWDPLPAEAAGELLVAYSDA